MKKIEPLFIVFFLIAFVLKQYHLAGADGLSIFTFTGASLFYYAFTFFIIANIPLNKALKKSTYSGINPLKVFAAVALGWDIAILIIGVFFKFMLLPGGEMMLMYGLVALAVFFILFAIFFKRTQDAFFKRALYRIVVIGFIGFITATTSIDSMIDSRFSEHPAYADAVKEYYHSNGTLESRENMQKVFEETYGKGNN